MMFLSLPHVAKHNEILIKKQQPKWIQTMRMARKSMILNPVQQHSFQTLIIYWSYQKNSFLISYQGNKKIPAD